MLPGFNFLKIIELVGFYVTILPIWQKQSQSPFQFSKKNSFIHKISNQSENNEENENYAMQDNEILNTKEATANF